MIIDECSEDLFALSLGTFSKLSLKLNKPFRQYYLENFVFLDKSV